MTRWTWTEWAKHHHWPPPRAWRIAYVCLALRVLNTLGPNLAGTALLRLLEATVCRRYYRQTDPSAIVPADNDMVPEMKCKVAGVQAALSDFEGVNGMISIVPSFLGAVPYLIWSRVVDKRILLLIYLLSYLASFGSHIAILYFYNVFDVKWIYLTHIFSLLGSSPVAFASIVSSIAAEALPPDSLTAYYLYSSAILMVVGFVSNFAGLELMKRSLWSAVMTALGFHVLSIPVLSILETDHGSDEDKDDIHGHPLRRIPSHDDDDEEEENEDDEEDDEAEIKPYPRSLAEALDVRTQISKLLAATRRHSFHILIFVAHKCGGAAGVLLPQWMSKRYDRTLREVGFVQLGERIWTTVLLLLIPRLHKRLSHRRQQQRSSQGQDRVTPALIRWSVLCSIIGTLLVSLSWSLSTGAVGLAVLAAGSGFSDLMLAFVTKTMDRADVAQIYLCISMVDIVVGRLVMTGVLELYGVVLAVESWGHVGMALPLWLGAALMTSCFVLVRML